jgi:O-antigen/teichoic acid export membrane protein
MLRAGLFFEKYIEIFLPILQGLNRRHLSEILWLLFSNGASLVLGFAIIKIIATIGTIEYGKYALVLSIVPLANAIIYASLDYFCQRYYYTFTYDDKKPFFLKTVIRLIYKLIFLLISICIVLLIILKLFIRVDLNDLIFCLIACGYILFYSSSVPLLGLLNTMRMRKLVALFASGEKFMQLILLLGIFYLIALNATIVLSVFMVVFFFSFLGKVRIVQGEVGDQIVNGADRTEKIPKDFLQLLVYFGIPFVGFGILAWLQTNGERWAVQMVMGLDAVGIFCFMSMVANTIFNAVQVPISAFIGPIILEKFADINDARRLALGMKIIWLNAICCSLITICGAAFLLLFGKILLTKLGSAAFASHYPLLPVIFMGIGLYTIGQCLTTVGFGYNKMRKYTLAKVSAAIMTVFCYLGGAYYWGLAGVSWGLVISSITYVLLVINANRSICKQI